MTGSDRRCRAPVGYLRGRGAAAAAGWWVARCGLLAFAACGAEGADAPRLPTRPPCPSIDEHAAALLDATRAGGTTALRAFFDAPATRAALLPLLRVALRLAPQVAAWTRAASPADAPSDAAAAAGAATDAATAADASAGSVELGAGSWALLRAAADPAVADLIDRIGAPFADGSTAATAALRHLGVAVDTCLSAEALRHVAAWARDPRLAGALPPLLTSTPADVAAAAAALGVPTPLGLQTLLGAILESAAHPAFHPDPLRATLVDAVALAAAATPAAAPASPADGAGFIAALIVALDVATRDLNGAVAPPRLAATRAICACLLAADADPVVADRRALLAALVRVLWPAAAPAATMPTQSAAGGGPSMSVAPLTAALAAGLDALADDVAGRDALRQVFHLVAEPSALPALLPEVSQLWRSGALAGVVEAAIAALEVACAPPLR